MRQEEPQSPARALNAVIAPPRLLPGNDVSARCFRDEVDDGRAGSWQAGTAIARWRRPLRAPEREAIAAAEANNRERRSIRNRGICQIKAQTSQRAGVRGRHRRAEKLRTRGGISLFSEA